MWVIKQRQVRDCSHSTYLPMGNNKNYVIKLLGNAKNYSGIQICMALLNHELETV